MTIIESDGAKEVFVDNTMDKLVLVIHTPVSGKAEKVSLEIGNAKVLKRAIEKEIEDMQNVEVGNPLQEESKEV